jgi:hypothetical protein
VLVFVQVHAAAGTFLTLTDNGTSVSTFTLDAGTTAQPGGIWLYRANGISLPSSGNYIVTIASSTTAGTIAGGGIAYTGVASGAPTATNTGSNAGSTAVSSGSAAPAGSGALYFGAMSDNTGLNPETITLNWASGTQQFVNTNGAGLFACAAADSITGSGAQTAAWTLGDSTAWVAAIAVYESAAAAGPALSPQFTGRVPVTVVTNAGWRGAQHSR